MASRRTPDAKPATSTTPVPPPPAKAKAKAPAKKAAAPKKTTSPKVKPEPVTTPPRPVITEDMRRGMIAEGAYLRAEKRGFVPGHEDEDWLAAEAEVDRLLGAGGSWPPQ